MTERGATSHRVRARRPRAAHTSSGAASTSRSGPRPASPSSSSNGSAATASSARSRRHLDGRAADRHVQHLPAQVEPHRELAVERARDPRRDQQDVGDHRQLPGCVRRGAAQRLGDVALVHQRVEQGVQQDPRPRLPADRTADQHVRTERRARVDHRAGAALVGGERLPRLGRRCLREPLRRRRLRVEPPHPLVPLACPGGRGDTDHHLVHLHDVPDHVVHRPSGAAARQRPLVERHAAHDVELARPLGAVHLCRRLVEGEADLLLAQRRHTSLSQTQRRTRPRRPDGSARPRRGRAPTRAAGGSG